MSSVNLKADDDNIIALVIRSKRYSSNAGNTLVTNNVESPTVPLGVISSGSASGVGSCNDLVAGTSEVGLAEASGALVGKGELPRKAKRCAKMVCLAFHKTSAVQRVEEEDVVALVQYRRVEGAISAPQSSLPLLLRDPRN